MEDAAERTAFAVQLQIDSDSSVVTMRIWRLTQSEAQVAPPPGQLFADSSVDLELRAHQLLAHFNVTYGVSPESISRLCAQAVESGQRVESVVARSKKPQEETDEYLRFAPKIRVLDPMFCEPNRPKQQQSVPLPGHPRSVEIGKQIDFREVRSYVVVAEKELLAVRVPARAGELGYDIHGQALPFGRKSYIQPKPGPNIVESEGKLYAETAGMLNFNRQSFWVDTKMVIDGDLDYHFGNIRFPGDLELLGAVRDQFKIWIAGSLRAAQTLDVFQIQVGGDVEVAQGILGHGRGILRSKGTVTARFIENCGVDSLKSIRIEKAAFMSQLFCREEVLARKGKIIGGLTSAGNLIDVQHLGNSAGIRTKVTLGVDFAAERLIATCRDRLEKLVRFRRSLANRLRTGDISKAEFDKRFAQLREEEETISERMVELMPRLDSNDSAILRIRGTVYPGTEIRICSLSLSILKSLSSVEFYIDKSRGVILDRKLQAK